MRDPALIATNPARQSTSAPRGILCRLKAAPDDAMDEGLVVLTEAIDQPRASLWHVELLHHPLKSGVDAKLIEGGFDSDIGEVAIALLQRGFE